MVQRRTNGTPFISKSGSDLVLKLYNAIRSLMSAQHDISVLREMVRDLLKNEGRLSIQIDGDRFLLNDKKIEMRSGHVVHRILLSEFKKRRIGRIEFSDLPDFRDLEEFLRSLMGVSGNGEHNGGALQKILQEKNIESVRVEAPTPGAGPRESGLPHGRNAYYTQIYFYTMQLVKGIFTQAARGESLDLSLARRVMRTMVSGCVSAPADLMALATIKTNREFLANHSVNVAIYAIALGHRLGLSKRFLVDLALAALFHDIGESRLAWVGRTGERALTEQEWEEAKIHPTLGVKILMGAAGLDETTLSRLITGVFAHHLRYDLSGFPRLRKKRESSLVGRIVSLADFYDLAARPYGRNRFPCFSDRLLEMIMDRSERDFDPVLAKYFVRILGMFPVGTLCRLDTGELGIVCSLMEEGTTGERPWVRFLVPEEETYRGGDLVTLNAIHEETGKYRHSIVEVLDPNDLGVDVAEFLIEF